MRHNGWRVCVLGDPMVRLWLQGVVHNRGKRVLAGVAALADDSGSKVGGQAA